VLKFKKKEEKKPKIFLFSSLVLLNNEPGFTVLGLINVSGRNYSTELNPGGLPVIRVYIYLVPASCLNCRPEVVRISYLENLLLGM
jgi:hypothetical protein